MCEKRRKFKICKTTNNVHDNCIGVRKYLYMSFAMLQCNWVESKGKYSKLTSESSENNKLYWVDRRGKNIKKKHMICCKTVLD